MYMGHRAQRVTWAVRDFLPLDLDINAKKVIHRGRQQPLAHPCCRRAGRHAEEGAQVEALRGPVPQLVRDGAREQRAQQARRQRHAPTDLQPACTPL